MLSLEESYTGCSIFKVTTRCERNKKKKDKKLRVCHLLGDRRSQSELNKALDICQSRRRALKRRSFEESIALVCNNDSQKLFS